MSVVASTVSSVWVVLFDDPQDLDLSLIHI